MIAEIELDGITGCFLQRQDDRVAKMIRWLLALGLRFAACGFRSSACRLRL